MTDSSISGNDPAAVIASNLHKVYGEIVAVSDSSFTVPEGRILGIIGPNGSGKTTTLKMLSGLLTPTSGTAEVSGYDSTDPDMKHILGYLPEESPLYEDMTGVGYLQFFAKLYDIPSDVADERIHEMLDRLKLDKRTLKIGNMSKGMKRKVAIARSLINDPEVLIYDEPASGLDPLSTKYIIEFIKELRDEGRTIVFSAHNLFHVADICDDVIIMLDGEMAAHGELEEIYEKYGETTYSIYSTTPHPESSEAREGYITTVTSHEDVERVESYIEDHGGDVTDLRTSDSSLEDIFIALAEEL